MKNKIIIALSVIIGLVTVLSMSCTVSKKVQDKEGSELWSENCGRCHNAPGASNYTAQQWEIIGTHMRMRAQLTASETKKIVEFFQSSN
jgi:cytochrome c553